MKGLDNMKSIKRYNLMDTYGRISRYGFAKEIDEDEEGEYVKYEDIKQALDALDKINQALFIDRFGESNDMFDDVVENVLKEYYKGEIECQKD